MKPKILIFDIETTPNLAYIWGKYEQDALGFIEEWKMLCISYKWQGGKTFAYGTDKYTEKQIVKMLWDLFNEADIIIGHNGDKFDIKKTNAKFIEFGLKPPEPYKTIDTLKVARKHFAFTSNKLGDLGIKLGVGSKVETGGFKLWLGCMQNNPRSWSLMKKYNKEDVDLLERVYLKLRPWMTTHPNLNHFLEVHTGCPNCASRELIKRGFGYSKQGKYQRLQCKDCGAWTQTKYEVPKSVSKTHR